MQRIDLFGGAIQAEYPLNITDASDLRQIPDTQEVYLSNDSDLSIILEVLELVREGEADQDLESAIKFHFDSLAHDNSALSSIVSNLSTNPPSNTTTHSSMRQLPTQVQGPVTLHGIQIVSKFNLPASEADKVELFVALWRLPQKNTDLVLSVNLPVGKASDNAAITTTNGVNGSDAHQQPEAVARAKELFETIVRTLDIKDYGLFAG
ncbi:hypothetical protein OIO90_000338 [Microbotryomycetes sp. JL221]|nr:hypothetical protein OIO90_000338 [Microbotryomycetes sp. JL221]